LVLIPFIDEGRLLEALATREPFLTAEEKARNRHSLPLLCHHTDTDPGGYPSTMPGIWPDLHSHAVCETMMFPHTKATDNHVQGLVDSYSPDVYFPGFPTFRYLPHHSELKALAIKVFNFPSKNPSRVVVMGPAPMKSAEDPAASKLLGTGCLVRYPHLVEARVVSVSSAEGKWSLRAGAVASGKQQHVFAKHSAAEISSWHSSASELHNNLLMSRAVDTGQIRVVVSVHVASGSKVTMDDDGLFRKHRLWSPTVSHFSLQTVVTDASCVWKDPLSADVVGLAERFPSGTGFAFTGQPGYGALGRVVVVDSRKKRISVRIHQHKPPDIRKALAVVQQARFMPSYEIAKAVGMSGLLISRLTSSIFVLDGSAAQPGKGKLNIGLNLKNSKQGLEIPGCVQQHIG